MKSISERLIKGSGIYALGKILPKVMGFILIPLYTRFLTTSDYGIVAVASVIIDIMIIILSMGLPASVTRYYFDYAKELKEFRDYLGSIFIVLLLMSLTIILSLTFFGKPIFTNLFSEVPFSPYIKLALWTSFFTTMGIIPLNLYRAKERALLYISLTLSHFIITTGFIVYFVVVLREGALGKIKGVFYASLILSVIYLILTIQKSNFTLSKSKIFSAFSFGLPLVPHALSALILSSADRILLERLSTLSQVGLYNIGYQIGQAFTLIMSSIAYAWVPIYYSIAKDELEHKAKKIFSRMATLYIAFGAILAAGVILFSKEIIYFMTTEGFYDSHLVVPLIAAGYFIYLIYIMSVRALYLKKRTYIVAPITILAAIINIGLNILWIPDYGMMGAAYATLISFLIQSILILIFAQKTYYIPYEYINLIIITALLGCIYFINNYFDLYSIWISLVVKFCIFITFIGALFLFNILSLKDLTKVKEVFFKRKY
jgi:O-antigen/teichoic acid export membrane protein